MESFATSVAEFFTSFEALVLLGIVVLTQLLKRYVIPRWGETGVHVVVFVLSVLGVIIWYGTTLNAEFGAIVVQAIKLLSYAVAAYEVILKKLPFFGSVSRS